jgi:hypothetical protein
MHTVFQLLPELILVAAVSGALQMLVLAFRNPFRPRWLSREWAAITAALAVVVLVSTTIGAMISGAMAAGLALGGAMLLTLVTFIGTGYALGRAFDFRERLRQADAGQSPFYRPASFNSLARGWRRMTGGGAAKPE